MTLVENYVLAVFFGRKIYFEVGREDRKTQR